MTFSKQPPTTPGFHAWRLHEVDFASPLEVYKIGDGSLSVDFPIARRFNCNVERIGGEWCRLVPAEEVPNAIIAAYEEAMELSVRGLPPISCRAILTAKINNAKRVMEGRE